MALALDLGLALRPRRQSEPTLYLAAISGRRKSLVAFFGARTRDSGKKINAPSRPHKKRDPFRCVAEMAELAAAKEVELTRQKSFQLANSTFVAFASTPEIRTTFRACLSIGAIRFNSIEYDICIRTHVNARLHLHLCLQLQLRLRLNSIRSDPIQSDSIRSDSIRTDHRACSSGSSCCVAVRAVASTVRAQSRWSLFGQLQRERRERREVRRNLHRRQLASNRKLEPTIELASSQVRHNSRIRLTATLGESGCLLELAALKSRVSSRNCNCNALALLPRHSLQSITKSYSQGRIEHKAATRFVGLVGWTCRPNKANEFIFLEHSRRIRVFVGSAFIFSSRLV